MSDFRCEDRRKRRFSIHSRRSTLACVSRAHVRHANSLDYVEAPRKSLSAVAPVAEKYEENYLLADPKVTSNVFARH
jgi:hypothetical protein